MIYWIFLLLLFSTSARASTLSDLADSMTADTWSASLNPSGTSVLLDDGASDFKTGDAVGNACWDTVAKKAFFIGSDHNTPIKPVALITYDEATNTFTQATTPFSTGTVNHGWASTACDMRGRKIYRMNISSLELWVYDMPTLTWSSLGNPPSGVMALTTSFPGLAWFPERGSRGQLIIANQESGTTGVLVRFDPTLSGAARWARINTVGNFSDSVSFAAYSEIHRVVVFANAGSTGPQIVKPDGTITQGAAWPACAPRINRNGIIHADPVTGNMVMICGGGTASWQIYNPQTNTWTAKAAPGGITNHILNLYPSTGGTWPTWGKVGVPISEHGVIMYIACQSSVACGTRIYKGGTFTTVDRDWKRRQYAPGVIRAVGFDSPNEILSDGPGTNVTGVSATPGIPALDSSIKASGVSSLKWTMTAGQDGNSAGMYGTNFMPDMSFQVGPTGQSPANVINEYWIQVRIRVDTNYATSVKAMSIGPKMMWIAGTADRPGAGATSCTQQEVVLQPSPGFQDVMMVYHACPGTFQPGSNFLFTRECGAGNTNCTNTLRARELQQGDIINCTYQNASGVVGGSGSRDTCKRQGDNPNTWKTFTAHVKVPTWYANNSSYRHDSILELWVTEEGGTRTKIINFTDGHASCSSQTSTLAPDETCGWDFANTSSGSPSNPIDRIGKIWFTTYSNGVPFPNGGQYWIDDLIIAQNDPGDPGAPIVPPTAQGGSIIGGKAVFSGKVLIQ